MRRTIYNMIIALGMMLPFASCADEELTPTSTVEEGLPVVLSMDMTLPELDSVSVATRAGDMSASVYDFYLFIIDAEGNIEDKYYFDQSGTSSIAAYSSNGDATISQKTPNTTAKLSNIKTTSGTKYIMGVANSNMKGDDNSIRDELSNVKTKTQLEQVLAVEPTIDGTVFTMSGYYSATTSESTTGEVTLPAGEYDLVGYIHLKRVDAHINFSITCTNKNATFQLTSWQVVDVAKYAHLFPNDNDATDAGYYSSAEIHQYSVSGSTYSFEFYMQERMSKTNNTISSYGQRAAWQTPLNEDGSKSFTNAPKNATYVILKGHYSGQSSIADANATSGTHSEDDVEADVTYFIFLGHDSDTDFTDFTTQRNTKYTYNVSISGVEDISVEVRHKKEERPDAEGDIILNVADPITLDAHFCAVVLSFSEADVKEAKDNESMGYAVHTPYGDAIYRHGAETDTEQAPYAAWVHFLKSTYTENGTHYPARYPENGTGLLTIKGLLDDLNKETFSNGTVYYTAFVDEFYYDEVPESGGTTRAATADEWKNFVNKDDRRLLILANTEESNDLQSSITSATYAIRQKSIQSIYNTDKDLTGLTRAWGLESIEEDLTAANVKSFPKDGSWITDGSDLRYGRHNATEMNRDSWNSVITNTGYLNFTGNTVDKNMIYACMQRNRDLNGDGRISGNEVRWYVPTLYQYQQMFIGMYGINEFDARLYYNEYVADTWEYKHYISSYNEQILWSEEGLSDGHYGSTLADNFRIRCVRDLGVTLSDNDFNSNSGVWTDDNQYQDIFTYNADTRTIELTYLNENSVRQSVENKEVSAPCTTFSENNKPVACFEYQANLIGDYGFKDQNDLADNEQNTRCGTTFGQGWRLPTLTELNIMQQANQALLRNSSNQLVTHLTRTKFEFYEWNGYTAYADYSKIPAGSRVTVQRRTGGTNRNPTYTTYYYGRYAHLYQASSTNFYLTNGDDTNLTGYIRCVKDKSQSSQ